MPVRSRLGWQMRMPAWRSRWRHVQALAFGLTVISEFGEFTAHRLVGAAHDGAPKRRGRVIGHITVWIMGKKLRTAEDPDQPIEPDQKARLLVAFADSGIRR